MIRAELTGSSTASACGIITRGSSPLLKLCGKLVEAGHNPATPLEAYRRDVLCLKIRSIREASELRIRGNGVGFESQESRPTVPLVSANGKSDRPPTEHRADAPGTPPDTTVNPTRGMDAA